MGVELNQWVRAPTGSTSAENYRDLEGVGDGSIQIWIVCSPSLEYYNSILEQGNLSAEQ
jgi:hypothetical protein